MKKESEQEIFSSDLHVSPLTNLNTGNARHDTNFSQKRTITWEISDFESLPTTAGYFLDSLPFMMGNATWCLRMYPKVKASDGEYEDFEEEEDEYDDDVSYVDFAIVRLKSFVPQQTLSYTLLLDGYYREDPRVHTFDEDHKEDRDTNFITRELAPDCFTDTGALRLTCEINHGSPHLDASFEVEQFTKTVEGIESLCQNMKNALQHGQNYDLVLKVQGKKIRAHKDILRVRSPVFEAMLTHDMIEKKSGVVDILDCDPQAFQQFLLYLYSAEVETLNSENVLALYHIAHKYDVEHLKEICRDFIKKRSSPSNITHVIQYALKYSDLQLLECTTQYFVKNINLIVSTDEWKVFMQSNSVQANQMLLKAVEKLLTSGMQ